MNGPAAATSGARRAPKRRLARKIEKFFSACPDGIAEHCESCALRRECPDSADRGGDFGAALRIGVGNLVRQMPKWVTLTALIVVWLAWGLVTMHDRSGVRAAAEAYLQSLAFSTAQHTSRSFSQVDQMLRIARSLYLEHGEAVSDILQGWRRSGLIDSELVPQIGIIDASGIYVASDLPGFKRMSLADREHFLEQRNGAGDRPFVGKPVVGRASGRASIQITRRIETPDGRFAGVAVVSLSPDYFITKFKPLLGASGTIALVGLDGISRLRLGGEGEMIGADVTTRPWFREGIAKHESGLVEYQARFDSDVRIAAYHRLEQYPLGIIVSMPMDQVFATHYMSRRFYLFSAALMSIMLIILIISSTLMITRQRRVSARLGASQQLAEEANKAKDRFISVVSHELRTPLHGIMGNAELLLDKEVDEDVRESAEAITTSSNHLLQVVTQLLDAARLSSDSVALDIQAVPLRPLLASVVSTQQPYASQKGLGLLLQIAPDAAEDVIADRQGLTSVLHNLLSNAIKFTPHGTVTLRAVREAGATRIEVEDTGIGIKREELRLLFQPFSQLSDFRTRSYHGTGLGLVISKTIVAKMGGDIEVRSEADRGSTFYFSLPVPPAARAETAAC